MIPILLVALACPCVPQEPAAAPAASLKPYRIGTRVADEIVLSDLAGQEHRLFAENEGRALVLVFWSFQDPVSRSYVDELTRLQRAHAEALRVLLIDSNHDELVAGAVDPLDKVRRYFEEQEVELPLLLDRGNRVADDFGATANAQAFLLDANSVLRYQGGIDDDPRGERRKQEQPVRAWLATALELVLRGEKLPASETWTRPSGRPIRRTPDAPGNR